MTSVPSNASITLKVDSKGAKNSEQALKNVRKQAQMLEDELRDRGEIGARVAAVTKMGNETIRVTRQVRSVERGAESEREAALKRELRLRDEIKKRLFVRRAMVAAGAMTALTGQMGFLGVGFGAMAGGGLGSAINAFSLAVGSGIRTINAAVNHFETTIAEASETRKKAVEAMKMGVDAAAVSMFEQSDHVDNVNTGLKVMYLSMGSANRELKANILNLITFGRAARIGAAARERGLRLQGEKEAAEAKEKETEKIKEATDAFNTFTDSMIDASKTPMQRRRDELSRLATGLPMDRASLARVGMSPEEVMRKIGEVNFLIAENEREEAKKLALEMETAKFRRDEARKAKINADIARRESVATRFRQMGETPAEANARLIGSVLDSFGLGDISAREAARAISTGAKIRTPEARRQRPTGTIAGTALVDVFSAAQKTSKTADETKKMREELKDVLLKILEEFKTSPLETADALADKLGEAASRFE